MGGQVDYFFKGTSDPSPYVFGAVGLVDITDSDETPKSIGGGLGYRIPAGDNLAFRVDGRFVHFTEGAGNVITVGLSIGGLFGQK